MMGWSEGDDQIENIATKMGSGFKIIDFRHAFKVIVRSQSLNLGKY